jgi:hypothetical protein
VGIAGEFAKVNQDEGFYRIELASEGPQRIFKDATTLDGSVAWLTPPEIWVTVIEPISGGGVGHQAKWEYEFGPLGVGDDFVMQGQIYRVSAIDTKALKFVPPYGFDGFCHEALCNPSADIVKLGREVSSSGRHALVLSKLKGLPTLPAGDSASIGAKSDECLLDLYLDAVEKNGHGYIARIKSKLDAYYYRFDQSKCHEKIPTGIMQVGVGDSLDFGNFGRFIVEAIWPATPTHQDWVILVPEDTKIKAK